MTKWGRPILQLAVATVALSALIFGSMWGFASIFGPEELYIAASRGDGASVDFWLRLGASPDSAFEDGDTALSTAIDNDDLPMVRKLLKAGANPNLAGRLGKPLNAAKSERMKDLLRQYGALR